jgi:MFS family permease
VNHPASPLALLFIRSFLVPVDMRILAPVLPFISTSLGSSPGAIGLAMTGRSLAYGTGPLFYGPLAAPCSKALKRSISLKSLYPPPLSDSKRFGGGIL